MITSAIRERLLREEAGFTLTEMMITTMIMIVVLMALYSIFDMSLRAFSSGNNKVEAVESARVGLEKMEREIRAAYPVDSSVANPYLFFNANGVTSNPPQQTPTQDGSQITFGNNLGAPAGEAGAADGAITCGTPCEYITYKLSPEDPLNPDAPRTLLRVNTSNSADAGDPVVENVAPGGLTFHYFKGDGTDAITEGEIRMVLITLDVQVDSGIYNPANQTLTTVVDLRNR